MKLEEYLESEIKKQSHHGMKRGYMQYLFFLDIPESAEKYYPEFSVGYNTEEECNFAPAYSEERWNFAFWCQNNKVLLSPTDKYSFNLLLEWCKEQKITNFGEPEEEDNIYDSNNEYIGKGPGGCFELMQLIASIARKLQSNNFIKERLGNIPIIIHDLEYTWFLIEEGTVYANPNGEADIFLEAYNRGYEHSSWL